MKPTVESRSCRSHARSTGVLPDGAHVRRRSGCSMKPLSSSKIIGLPLRSAPFLCGANPGFASDRSRCRRLRVPVVRASGTSNQGRAANDRRNRGDMLREIFSRPHRPPADKSKNPFDSRPFAVRPEEFSPVVVSAERSTAAAFRDVVWLAKPLGLLSPQPAANVSRNSKKRQHSPALRSSRPPPAGVFLPASDELPVRLRFLSVSSNMVRMSTNYGSLKL